VYREMVLLSPKIPHHQDCASFLPAAVTSQRTCLWLAGSSVAQRQPSVMASVWTELIVLKPATVAEWEILGGLPEMLLAGPNRFQAWISTQGLTDRRENGSALVDGVPCSYWLCSNSGETQKHYGNKLLFWDRDYPCQCGPIAEWRLAH
jgi:hypothetical protein